MSADILNRPIEPMPDFAGILRAEETFGSGSDEAQGVGDNINNAFDRLMIQSGIGIAPSLLLFFCFFAGLVVGGMTFIIQENPLTASMMGAFGAVGPILAVIIIRSNRQRKMQQQLPSMIDELARAAKTGRSIQQCWEIVANDTAEPLGSELQNCSRRLRMGEDLPMAIQDLPYRTGIVTLNILVTALSVHHQTGGDLVSVLSRLSETIRDRLLFLGRLRAATTGSRATAVLMLVLPLAIVGFFTMRDPEYFPRLMRSDMGRNITLIAIGLQILGTSIIMNILRNSQRS